MRPAIVLLLLACLAFAPFFGYPEWRGTEARRVQIAQEMVDSGDYIVPRLWSEETFAKPPFYYWVLAVQLQLFGLHDWSMRLPSLLGFFLLSLIAFYHLRRWHGEASAWLGAAGLLLSPILMYDAPFAEIDPLFSVLTVLSLLILCDGVYRGRRGGLLLAGVLGGLAVMTKGPPYLMFCVGPLVLWWKHSRLASAAWYFVPVIGLYAVYKVVLDSQAPVHAGGGEGVAGVAVAETLGRLSFWTSKSLAGIPQHLVMAALVVPMPFTIWFWSWYRVGRRRSDAGSWRQNFLVWAGVSGLFILLFSSGRSMRYLMPAIPLVILGVAPLVAVSLRSDAAPSLVVRRSLAVLGIVGGLGLLASPFARFPYPGSAPLVFLALASVTFFLGSQRRVVLYCLSLPLILAWSACPDRVLYHATTGDFAPDPAGVLARELTARGIDAVGVYSGVNTSLLLHMSEAMGGLSLRRDGDAVGRVAPASEWLIASDRGYVQNEERRARELVEIDGYREVLRVQMGRKKSVSLRERR